MYPSVECRQVWYYVASVQSLPAYELMCASSWIAIGKWLVWVKRGVTQFSLFVCAIATCLSLFCLQEMQQGVNDVLPGPVFDSLTAEDLHLLMNGSPVVDVEVLKKITSFMDESCECHMTPGACHLADVAHASPIPCVSCV